MNDNSNKKLHLNVFHRLPQNSIIENDPFSLFNSVNYIDAYKNKKNNTSLLIAFSLCYVLSVIG